VGCIGLLKVPIVWGSLTWHIKLSPPVGECCPSVGVTPGATPDYHYTPVENNIAIAVTDMFEEFYKIFDN